MEPNANASHGLGCHSTGIHRMYRSFVFVLFAHISLLPRNIASTYSSAIYSYAINEASGYFAHRILAIQAHLSLYARFHWSGDYSTLHFDLYLYLKRINYPSPISVFAVRTTRSLGRPTQPSISSITNKTCTKL